MTTLIRPTLALTLHHEYTREQIYGVFGIRYNSKQQHLNLGLSPLCPDGGYFIFATLIKDDFDPAYQYEDELYGTNFTWVTRRGREQDHRDYVALRQPTTRVSLFVRNRGREPFTYLGELLYHEHRQTGTSTTAQQIYDWRLETAVPDELLERLTFGSPQFRNSPQRVVAQPLRTRKPGTFDEWKKAYSYAVGDPNRTIIPAHHNYQVALNAHLRAHGIECQLEEDFIDVSFPLNSRRCIGEIKVTTNLRLAQAFRMAVGQLLDYAWSEAKDQPVMIMFLDQVLDQRRIDLASALKISVLVKQGDTFALLNPTICPDLQAIFFRHQLAHV